MNTQGDGKARPEELMVWEEGRFETRQKRMRITLVLSFLLSLTLSHHSGHSLPLIVQLICCTLIEILAGGWFLFDILKKPASPVFRPFSLLVLLSTGAAYVYSVVITLRGGHHAMHHVIFHASGSVLVYALLIRYLAENALWKSGERLRGMTKRAESAGSVKEGEYFTVAAGDIVPADGLVEEGEGSLDTWLLTSDRTPVPKKAGDRILGQSVCAEGSLHCKADRAPEEQVYPVLTGLLEKSLQKNDTKSRMFSGRVLKWIFPGGVLLSVCVFFLCWRVFLPGEVSASLLRAAAVLTALCPVPLFLGSEIPYRVSANALSESGILVRSGAVLDRLYEAKSFSFSSEDRKRAGMGKTEETLKRMGREALETGRSMDGKSADVFVDGAGDDSPDRVQVLITPPEALKTEGWDLMITQDKVTHLLKGLYASNLMTQTSKRVQWMAPFVIGLLLVLSVCGVLTPVWVSIVMTVQTLLVIFMNEQLETELKNPTFEGVIKSEGGRKKSKNRWNQGI